MKVETTKKPKTTPRFSTVLSRKLSRYRAPTLSPDARLTSRLDQAQLNSSIAAPDYVTFRRTRKIVKHLVQPPMKIKNRALLHDYIKTIADANPLSSVPYINRGVFGVRWLAMYRLREAKLHRQLTAQLSYALSADVSLLRDNSQYKKLFEYPFYAKLIEKLRARGAAVYANTESYLYDAAQRTAFREQCLFSGLAYLSAIDRQTEFFTDLPRIKELARQSKENIHFILLELAFAQFSLERKSHQPSSLGTHDKRIGALREVFRVLKRADPSESPLTVLIDNTSGARVPKLSHLLSNKTPSLAALSDILTISGQKPGQTHKSLFRLLNPVTLQLHETSQSSVMEKEKGLVDSVAFENLIQPGELEPHKVSLSSTAVGEGAALREPPQKRPIIKEVIEYRRVSRTRAGGRSRRVRVLVVIGRKTGWVGVGLGKHKYTPEATQKAKREASKNIFFLRRTAVGSISHTVEGKFKRARVLLRPLPVGSGMMTGSCLKNVLVLAGYSNVWGLQMGTPNKICNVRAVLDALGQLRSDVEIIGARQNRRENTNPQAGLVAALKMYAKS